MRRKDMRTELEGYRTHFHLFQVWDCGDFEIEVNHFVRPELQDGPWRLYLTTNDNSSFYFTVFADTRRGVFKKARERMDKLKRLAGRFR